MNASEISVCDYLKNKFPSHEFIVESLPTRDGAQSRAFKLTCDFLILGNLYLPETWPKGVVVKRFFRPRPAKIAPNIAL